MLISIVINADTREGFQNESSSAEHMFDGCKSEDFLIDGVLNKIKFFDGFDKEVILHIDRHNDVPDSVLQRLQQICDTVLIRKHTHENNFNDWNYLRALKLARGDVICHLDQDTAAFAESPASIQSMIDLLSGYSFVSYPSHWSPRAVHDESFGKRTWASTRFFLCKKEALKFDELENCIKEPNWGYEKYGDSPRRCNWLEHFLTLINNDSCYYPPMNIDQLAIFSWASYRTGILKELNNKPYPEVIEFINSNGGIQYPVDLRI